MKGKRNGMMIVAMLALLVCTVLGVPKNGRVLAEVTEATTEAFTGETSQESTQETTEPSTETDTTEECTEENVDETSPQIELICLDEDQMAQSEIKCRITVTEEHLADTTVYVEHTAPEGEMQFSTVDDLVIENEIPKEFCFSQEGFYQVYAKSKDEAGNETTTEKISFAIDRTVPMIGINMEGMKEGGSYATQKNKYEMNVEIQDVYLVMDSCEIKVWKDGEKKEFVCQWIEKSKGYYTNIVLDDGFMDGTYTFCVEGMDKAGNCNQKTISFAIDNTAAEVKLESNADIKQWTKEDILFQTVVEDTISGLQEITYKIKGEVIQKIRFREKTYQYCGEFLASEEADKSSGYTVVIEVTNGAGIKKTIKNQVYIDKTKPEISLTGVENGTHYNCAQEITTKVKDVSYKGTKTTYYVTRTVDGKSKKEIWKDFLSNEEEDMCVREVLREGYYEIYAVSTDSVGFQTRSNTLTFVIDCTAPVVDLRGVESEAIKKDPVTLHFSCVESFYSTNDVKIDIERTLDGETTVEQISGFSTEKNAVLDKSFEQDGTYVVEISAKDKAGNIAITKSITFVVDRTKPELKITGTGNHQMWSEPTTVVFQVEESFYEGNVVKITGTKTDIDGIVQNLELSQVVSTGKNSSTAQWFPEDGIYDIQICARDRAGNENAESIHFVIDQTNPEINGVEQYHGGYFQTFRLAQVMEEIFKDLTVVSYQMRLNGVEYNGTDEITQEGKYVLQIHVQDELQHENSKSVEFVVDSTPPEVLFYGVSEGETVYAPGEVTFRLENADDRIVGVYMNGKSCDTDIQSLSYEEYGSYEIQVASQDRAGNYATQTLTFCYADAEQNESDSYDVMCGVCVLICLGLFLGFCIRWKRREH